jgi:hypothetical protein
MDKIIIAPQASLETRKVEIKEHGNKKENKEDQKNSKEVINRCELRQKFTNLADQLAQSHYTCRNCKFPGSEQIYTDPLQSSMKFVTKFYANAKGGPLYVDEPMTEKQMLEAYERHKVMLKLNLRHIVIEKDSTLEDLYEDLETQRVKKNGLDNGNSKSKNSAK